MSEHVCMSVQACLCMHTAISAGVQGEALNCPLDFGVGREAGVLPLSQVKGHVGPARAHRRGLET